LHTRIGYDEMGDLLQRMVAAGWVGRVLAEAAPASSWNIDALRRERAGSDNWVLLLDPALIRLADVYRMFVFGGVGGAEAPADALPDSPLFLDTAALARAVEDAVEGGLGQTLA